MALNYNDMAAAMETALDQEWFDVKGEHLLGAGLEDRQLLFKAIARGMLHYLEAKQDKMFKSIRLRKQGFTTETDYDVRALNLNTMSGT